MISFILCENEKRVYMFPSGIADARKELTSYMDAS